MQSEVTWTQRDKYCMILLIRNLKNSQPYRHREWNGGSQDVGDGETKESLYEGHQPAATQELETRRATPCLQQTALHCVPEDCSEGRAHVKCSYHNKTLK